jgi:primosomal protein N' (replication factor Y)
MVVRVRLDLAVDRELDYAVPAELTPHVAAGIRVKVPLGNREVMGVVLAVSPPAPHAKLRPIIKIVGTVPLVTAPVMALARWIAEYYCCSLEAALKSVLPEAVRREKEGWRQRLVVRLVPGKAPPPNLTPRQRELLGLLTTAGELPLQALLKSAGTTAATLRRLEDYGLVTLQAEISERDPYAREEILPSQPLPLNVEQAQARNPGGLRWRRRSPDHGRPL